MERIISMILRRLLNKGMNSGIKAVANRGKRDGDNSPKQSQMNRDGKQQVRSLKQATRMLRRMNKL